MDSIGETSFGLYLHDDSESFLDAYPPAGHRRKKHRPAELAYGSTHDRPFSSAVRAQITFSKHGMKYAMTRIPPLRAPAHAKRAGS